MSELDRFRGCLLGLACGDAVGTKLEFSPPGSFEPVTDMTGGGPFALKPGEWTDDTSMAMCLAESLLEKGFDPVDQLEKYCQWWHAGYWSSNGKCFDIGNTVLAALVKFEQDGKPKAGPTHPQSAGNGSIMRLAPVPMFYHPDLAAVVHHSAESSLTTHGEPRAVDACRLLGSILVRALSGETDKDAILHGHSFGEPLHDEIAAIAAGAWKGKSKGEIRGSGYVVESLEAALWCFANAGSFEEAILGAANLGHDADTTAAICGQVAGTYWGESGIPQGWLEKLALGAEIGEKAEALWQATPPGA